MKILRILTFKWHTGDCILFYLLFVEQPSAVSQKENYFVVLEKNKSVWPFMYPIFRDFEAKFSFSEIAACSWMCLPAAFCALALID